MYVKHFIFIISILLLLSNYLAQGQNTTTTTNGTSPVTVPTTTTNISSTISCPEGDTNCLLIKTESKPTSRGGVRRLFFLFIGCLLTTCLIIAMIFTYNRVTEQRRRRSSTNPPTNPDGNNRFQNLLQTIGLNNLSKRGGLHFFSVSNNNHSSGSHRQGETSRTHLHENQDEALLFDDPYADGGISGGLHGSSTNPYKSLTLSVA